MMSALMSITIPIFVHTPETSAAHEQGLDFDLEDCRVQDVTFYALNYVKGYRSNGKEQVYSQIGCNGEIFVSPIPIQELNNIIKRAWTLQ